MLVAVAMLISIILSAAVAKRTSPLELAAWLVVSFAVLAFVVLIGTGGALSAMGSPPSAILWRHEFVPYMAILLAGLWLYVR